MTTFTRTWNGAYEAVPANSDDALEGAERIRNLKVDARERMAVDHSIAGDANDGEHLKVTLKTALAVKPTLAADETALYSKDVSAKAELFFEDEDGDEVQLTKGGAINSFPAGTRMLFHQTAAPTGWTKDTTINDKTLRVVSGTVSSGGATAFSSVFGAAKTTGSTAADLAAHTHTGPSHTHGMGHTHAHGSSYSDNSGSEQLIGPFDNVGSAADSSVQTEADGTGATGSTGAGGGHTHTLSLDLQYIDIIIASKD